MIRKIHDLRLVLSKQWCRHKNHCRYINIRKKVIAFSGKFVFRKKKKNCGRSDYHVWRLMSRQTKLHAFPEKRNDVNGFKERGNQCEIGEPGMVKKKLKNLAKKVYKKKKKPAMGGIFHDRSTWKRQSVWHKNNDDVQPNHNACGLL